MNGMLNVRPAPTPLIMINRILMLVLLPGCSVLLAPLARGQAAPPASSAPVVPEVLKLSTFEVKTTQGTGYRSTNTATGTKSAKPLIDIPSSVTIVTRDFIDDMISDQTIGDVLKYAVAGSPPSTNRNNFLQLRGQRFESPWTDGIRVSNSPNELSVVDSIEVLKGVNSVLYGTRVPAGGLVNRVTKKPQVKPRTTLKATFGDYDLMRFEADSTSAIPGTKDKLAYRLIGAWQDFPGYRAKRDQEAIAPMLQYASSGTTVRYQYIWSLTETAGELPGGIANPDGSVFLGGGQQQDYKAPWSFTRKQTGINLVTWLQEIGTWESRIAYMTERASREDEEHRRQGGANLITNTSQHRYFGQTELRLFDSIQQDIVGKYTLGGILIDTSVGWSFNHEDLGQGRQTIDLATGRAVGTDSRVTVATAAQGLLNITNPNLAAILLPGAADRVIPGNYDDTKTKVSSGTAYLTQSFDVVPERLTITLGGSYASEKSDVHQLPGALSGDTQIEAHRIDKSHDWLYSAGMVFSVSPKVKLFASTGTTFSPNQANATTPAGLRPPPVTGKSYEAGLKFNLMDDHVWGSVTLYQLDLKGFATFNSVINAFDVTDTYNKGVELELSVEPVRGLQFIGTIFNAQVQGPSGARVNQSYENTWSFWAKYQVSAGRFKGVYFGAGMFHRGVLIYSTGPNAPGYTTLDMTAGYATKRWSIAVSGRNLTDEIYNIGSTGSTNIDPSTPPTLQATFTYSF
jgi:iron complex outermembrane receptor protein